MGRGGLRKAREKWGTHVCVRANHDAAISGLGSTIKLRRRTMRRRCDSWRGAEAAIAQRT
jgi:hypothetical protein